MKLVRYNSQLDQEWDDFILRCPMATFLHSRKFLSYHKNRFQDQSLLCYEDLNNKLIAVFPAALHPNDTSCIISHPGITYGGILHQGNVLGHKMLDLIKKIVDYYSSQQFTSLIYKVIPYIYHMIPAADDVYALFLLKGLLYRRDLSCALDLKTSEQFFSKKEQAKMRNMIRKAKKNNVIISQDSTHLKKFWDLLENHLGEKYQKKPVHSYQEIKTLINLFPENIKLVTALIENEIVAGSLLFLTNKVYHTQYLVNSDRGKELFALDFLIQECINLAKMQQFNFFDFGISNEKEGRVLNQHLYSFKTKHAGTGITHDFYKIKLDS